MIGGSAMPRRLLGRPEAQNLAESRMPWIFGGMLLWVVFIVMRLLWLQVYRHKDYRVRAQQ
jgi:cell division protein FtsI/penicillin-binding protein 2